MHFVLRVVGVTSSGKAPVLEYSNSVFFFFLFSFFFFLFMFLRGVKELFFLLCCSLLSQGWEFPTLYSYRRCPGSCEHNRYGIAYQQDPDAPANCLLVCNSSFHKRQDITSSRLSNYLGFCSSTVDRWG